MLQKATENDRARIVQYCAPEAHINLFLLADIENFGFDSDVQDVWLQTKDARITGVVLRYFENYIYYAREEDAQPEEAAAFLKERGARLISGKLSLLERLQPLLQQLFRLRSMRLAILPDAAHLTADTSRVVTADAADAPEIARQYALIEEFSGLYTGGEHGLAKQIENRIRSGEGVHMYLREDGQIISHGNTTAETQASGMIGGILTLPQYRQQGRAEKIVCALCHSLLLRGKTPCLFFDNPAAGRLYYKLGFIDNGCWGVLEQQSERNDKR